MGIQFFIVLFLATLLNLNRPASFVAIWISNIATVVPIYTFNYWVGSLFWSGPSVKEVYTILLELTATLWKLDVWDMFEQFEVVMGLGADIIIPLCIGSVIVGGIAGVLAYIMSLAALRYLVIKRSNKRILH